MLQFVTWIQCLLSRYAALSCNDRLYYDSVSLWFYACQDCFSCAPPPPERQIRTIIGSNQCDCLLICPVFGRLLTVLWWRQTLPATSVARCVHTGLIRRVSPPPRTCRAWTVCGNHKLTQFHIFITLESLYHVLIRARFNFTMPCVYKNVDAWSDRRVPLRMSLLVVWSHSYSMTSALVDMSILSRDGM